MKVGQDPQGFGSVPSAGLQVGNGGDLGQQKQKKKSTRGEKGKRETCQLYVEQQIFYFANSENLSNIKEILIIFKLLLIKYIKNY